MNVCTEDWRAFSLEGVPHELLFFYRFLFSRAATFQRILNRRVLKIFPSRLKIKFSEVSPLEAALVWWGSGSRRATVYSFPAHAQLLPDHLGFEQMAMDMKKSTFGTFKTLKR